MARRFGRDHPHVDTFGWQDLLVMDVEAMRPDQGLRCFSSGMSMTTTSACLTASGTSVTVRPASRALSADFDPWYRPTMTSRPESCAFNAWAWPWLP